MNFFIEHNSPKVFIVEDEALIVMELRDRLTRLGYAVCGTAAKGEIALQQIPASMPEIVLMDIRLAGQLNGLETAERLGGLPVIFLTAYSDPDILEQAKKIAPYGYLTKPFEERELHATIQMAIYKHRLDRQLSEANSRLEEAVRIRTAELELANEELKAENEQRKQVEIQLRQFQQAVESTVDGIILVDARAPNQPITYVNPAFTVMTGYTPEDAIGRNCRILSGTDKNQPGIDTIRDAVMERHACQVTLRNHRKDGTDLWVNLGISPITRSGGEVSHFVGVMRDITEHQQAEDEVRLSEAKLRVTLDSISDAVLTTDIEGRVSILNPIAEQLTGWTHGEAKGRDVSDVYCVIDPHDRESINNPFRQMLANEEGHQSSKDIVLRARDGSERPIAQSAAPIRDKDGRKLGVVFVFRDVANERAASQKIASLLKELTDIKVALDHHSIVSITDPAGTITSVNDKFCETSKYSRDELIGTNHRIVNSHYHSKEFFEEKWASISQGRVWHGEIRNRAKDGTFYWVDTTIVPFMNAEGRPYQYVAIRTDITARKQAEERIQQDVFLRKQAEKVLRRSNEELERLVSERTTELRENEDRFRQIATSISHIFFVFSWPDNQFVYVSPAFETIWGRNAFELYASPRVWIDNTHIDDRLKVREIYNRWIQNPLIEAEEFEFRIYRPDGEIRWLSLRGISVQSDKVGGKRVTGIAEDVTEKKSLEGQFVKSQRLQAVGQLAGGIAHDFNNLLLVVSCSVEKLLAQVSDTDPHRKTLLSIRDAGVRAANLTRQLLAFSRRQVLESVVIDLNELIARSEQMIRQVIRDNVILTIIPSNDRALVNADPGQLDQILLNLILNAQDAMPRGGEITIEICHKHELASDNGDDGVLPLQQYIQLSISDSGCGMSEEVKSRMFEPYFTTKPFGKGTGLGLAVAEGIISQLGGKIHVDSLVGYGTTINIRLPSASCEAVTQRPVAEQSRVIAGFETILLVEDDPNVRQILKNALELVGYNVLEADHGPAAIATAVRYSDPIHLLLTDVAMPEMTGRDLADELRIAFPQLPVIFMSACADDTVVVSEKWNETEFFLQKPFETKHLLNKLREILVVQRPELK